MQRERETDRQTDMNLSLQHNLPNEETSFMREVSTDRSWPRARRRHSSWGHSPFVIWLKLAKVPAQKQQTQGQSPPWERHLWQMRPPQGNVLRSMAVRIRFVNTDWRELWLDTLVSSKPRGEKETL
jgi:hypothetical protein